MKGTDVVSCRWPSLMSICSSSDPFSMVSDGTRSVIRRKLLPRSSVASKFAACMRTKSSVSRRSKDDVDRRNLNRRRESSSTCLLGNASSPFDRNISSDHVTDNCSSDSISSMLPLSTRKSITHIPTNDVDALTVYPSSNQVIVLKVAIHCRCRGCENKLTKHLSRIEGVTSLEVDLAANKVLIVGDVAPSIVLGCLAKLKKMRFRTAVVSS